MRATSTTSKSYGTKASGTAAPKAAPASKKLPSRPSSNSMIAKAEREKEAGKEKEKAAWDRRRTYDPRRAVQQVVVSPRAFMLRASYMILYNI